MAFETWIDLSPALPGGVIGTSYIGGVVISETIFAFGQRNPNGTGKIYRYVLGNPNTVAEAHVAPLTPRPRFTPLGFGIRPADGLPMMYGAWWSDPRVDGQVDVQIEAAVTLDQGQTWQSYIVLDELTSGTGGAPPFNLDNWTGTNIAVNGPAAAFALYLEAKGVDTANYWTYKQMYYSPDGGATFQKRDLAGINFVNGSGMHQLLIAPWGTMFLSIGATGLFRSTDAGQTWTQVPDVGVDGLVVYNGRLILALTGSTLTGGAGVRVNCNDGEGTWITTAAGVQVAMGQKRCLVNDMASFGTEAVWIHGRYDNFGYGVLYFPNGETIGPGGGTGGGNFVWRTADVLVLPSKRLLALSDFGRLALSEDALAGRTAPRTVCTAGAPQATVAFGQRLPCSEGGTFTVSPCSN